MIPECLETTNPHGGSHHHYVVQGVCVYSLRIERYCLILKLERMMADEIKELKEILNQ